LVDLGLKRLLVESGLDETRDNIKIVPVPMEFLGEGAIKNFGVGAAKALQAGAIDGFWANGMGAEVAVRGGWGTMVIDARRGDGPPKAIHYTMPALITSEAVIARDSAAVAAAVRAGEDTKALVTSALPPRSAASYFRPRGFADRGHHRARSSVLRSIDLARIRRRHDRVPASHGAAGSHRELRGRGGDAVQPVLDVVKKRQRLPTGRACGHRRPSMPSATVVHGNG
jgi:hypothetical protein